MGIFSCLKACFHGQPEPDDIPPPLPPSPQAEPEYDTGNTRAGIEARFKEDPELAKSLKQARNMIKRMTLDHAHKQKGASFYVTPCKPVVENDEVFDPADGIYIDETDSVRITRIDCTGKQIGKPYIATLASEGSKVSNRSNASARSSNLDPQSDKRIGTPTVFSPTVPTEVFNAGNITGIYD